MSSGRADGVGVLDSDSTHRSNVRTMLRLFSRGHRASHVQQSTPQGSPRLDEYVGFDSPRVERLRPHEPVEATHPPPLPSLQLDRFVDLNSDDLRFLPSAASQRPGTPFPTQDVLSRTPTPPMRRIPTPRWLPQAPFDTDAARLQMAAHEGHRPQTQSPPIPSNPFDTALLLMTQLHTRHSRRTVEEGRLRQLPQIAFKAPAAAERCGEQDDKFMCAICQLDFEAGDKLLILPCLHRYHTDCIVPWATKERGECPTCRHPVLELGGDDFITKGSD